MKEHEKTRKHITQRLKEDLLCYETCRNPVTISQPPQCIKEHRALEIPSTFCIISLRVIQQQKYRNEINNHPCKLMRRGLYRNVYTKYLRH